MIKIDDVLYLDADQTQYVIYECKKRLKGKQSGKSVYEPIAFFGKIEQVRRWLFELKIKQDIDIIQNIDKVIALKNELGKLEAPEWNFKRNRNA